MFNNYAFTTEIWIEVLGGFKKIPFPKKIEGILNNFSRNAMYELDNLYKKT